MKFLLFKAGHIGDALLMTPTLRLLRKRFPQAQIDVAVRRGTEGVLEKNPDLDRLFLLPRPEKNQRDAREAWGDLFRLLAGTVGQRYDWAFDFNGSDRAGLYMRLAGARMRAATDAYGELRNARPYNFISKFNWRLQHRVLKDFRLVTDALQIEAEPGPMVVHTDDLPRKALAEKFEFLRDERPYAMIHPISRWAYKQWLPEGWAQVADQIAERHGLRVVFTCGPGQQEQEQIDGILALAKHSHEAVRGQATLRELAALYREARLFCGVDTVAMHLAAAAQTPTVALFGPSSEWSWGPWQTRHELVLGPCSCKLTRDFVCDKSRIFPCMAAITPEQVLEKVDRLLAGAAN
ncbi:MAG: putative lipopolysaccharide heptosyltransferase III [Prosthecobacter sp.]|nr:putative lipopolysaccharide heptosyltransferase III [Prosthecobacter sp.]